MNGLARTLGRVLAANSTWVCDEDEIRYGLEVFLGGLLQLLLLIAAGWLLGVLKALVAVLIASALYRRYAGGAHCNAYYRCTLTGLITFPTLAYLCRLINPMYFSGYFIFTIIFSLTIIYLRAPMDNEVKPVEDPAKRRQLRNQAAFMVVILLVAALVAYSAGQAIIAVALLLGICWQTLTMTRWGAMYMRFWDICFSRWWVNKLGKEEL